MEEGGPIVREGLESHSSAFTRVLILSLCTAGTTVDRKAGKVREKSPATPKRRLRRTLLRHRAILYGCDLGLDRRASPRTAVAL